jgi:hypothetical protein
LDGLLLKGDVVLDERTRHAQIDQHRRRVADGALKERSENRVWEAPPPAAVGVGGHACYDIPAPEFGGATHRLLVYHHVVDGVEHMELRYGPASCAPLPDWSLFTVWWEDYVR